MAPPDPQKPKKLLPGEQHPIRFEAGRAITDDEAWGVARRLASRTRSVGQQRSADVWPDPGEQTLAAYRIPTVTLWRVRARAEAEGLTVSEVVRDLLDAWGSAPMGSVVRVEEPDGDGG